MLHIQQLSKNFGDIQAVKDITFSANQGEIITLLGPNGAGKTTLIRLLSGILSPTSGEILFDDINMSEDRVAALRHIGYIPENSPMYANMTAFEFIKYAADLRLVPEASFRSRLDAMVTGLELSEALPRKISELSKGFRHRIGIAAALIHSPKILIMDEPTEGLDPNQKYIFHKFIKDFAIKGTVILSTHILEDTENLATRILLINHGQILQDTTPARLRYSMPGKDLATVFRILTSSPITTQEEAH